MHPRITNNLSSIELMSYGNLHDFCSYDHLERIAVLKILVDNIINIAYLSIPKRTRQEDASSLVQYLQPLAIRHGKSIVSARTFKITHEASINHIVIIHQ